MSLESDSQAACCARQRADGQSSPSTERAAGGELAVELGDAGWREKNAMAPAHSSLGSRAESA